MKTCPKCGLFELEFHTINGKEIRCGCGISGCRSVTFGIKDFGIKHDQDKPHMNLLLQEVPNALVEVAKALRMGEEKYGRGNWRVVENKEDRYLAALMRHLIAIHQGEHNDPESGLSHLAHVAVNALFLLDGSVNEKENGS